MGNTEIVADMRTFIDGVDLSGKVIHPFGTYAVSGMGKRIANGFLYASTRLPFGVRRGFGGWS
ncbi:hypothetical protein [Mycobacterium sp. URHB0021]